MIEQSLIIVGLVVLWNLLSDPAKGFFPVVGRIYAVPDGKGWKLRKWWLKPLWCGPCGTFWLSLAAGLYMWQATGSLESLVIVPISAAVARIVF